MFFFFSFIYISISMKCLQYKHCGIVLTHENQKVELTDLFLLDKLNEAESKWHQWMKQ